MEQPKINIDIKFNPEVTIIVAGKTLGRLGFTNVEQLQEFINRLKEQIEIIMKEFKNKEEKIVKIE